jgi:protein Tex
MENQAFLPQEIIPQISGISQKQILAVIRLLTEGASIPFISRYRKEVTGGLDEVAIEEISIQYKKLQDLEKRRESIITSLKESGQLTKELGEEIVKCKTLTELEDLYLPYKPKRKTRAVIAKAKGLEPLAKRIFFQNNDDPAILALKFLNKEVESMEEALQGARDIIAEWIAESSKARNTVRRMFQYNGKVKAKVKDEKAEGADKYKDYFKFEDTLKRIPSHRFLALKRGEREGFLKVGISPDKEETIEKLSNLFVRTRNESALQVGLAVKDSYQRLIAPSIENEVSASAKERADKDAINVFAKNLEQLLMAAPLGQKRILALDPGYRTGCKVVCLDEQGNPMHNETIYPHKPQSETSQAMKKLSSMVGAYKIEAIAIGNGTASRETEYFVKRIRFDRELQVFVVSEDGASVYSASSTAREEFPQFDVTVRGAISIGRRLMDPLAELVKIDPKSIGVGQYQYDVDQNKLRESLNQVVINTVNKVGVEVNTASKHLLSFISGLGPQLAQNIILYIKENGPLSSREELKKVPRMGDKSYEQCAGFLRISKGEHPLDNTAVHPESYAIVEKMATDQGIRVSDLIQEAEARARIVIEKYTTSAVGIPTLSDIMKELEKPGRDPRKKARVFEFDKGIHKIEDLYEGMILPGIVTNVTNFGAFVDIGIKQNGLIHISNLREEYISNPAEVVSVHQHLKVRVLEVDVKRERIQLSLRNLPQE